MSRSDYPSPYGPHPTAPQVFRAPSPGDVWSETRLNYYQRSQPAGNPQLSGYIFNRKSCFPVTLTRYPSLPRMGTLWKEAIKCRFESQRHLHTSSLYKSFIQYYSFALRYGRPFEALAAHRSPTGVRGELWCLRLLSFNDHTWLSLYPPRCP